MNWFLGLDNSTQSLSSLLISLHTGEVFARYSVDFDTDLPGYDLVQGVLPGPTALVKHSDPLAWVSALELLFQRMVDDGVDMGRIKAISGSAQQHGTVYLKKSFSELDSADVKTPSLVPVIKDMLSRRTSPIWMDSSTTAECHEIANETGGYGYVQRKTGSVPVERFSGPQIRKFYKEEPEKYEKTSKIHLVSSFMASLLTFRDAPIDYGDGAGMNLMDIEKGQWVPDILEATAPGLREKLPQLSGSGRKVGRISEYFIRNFGFSEDTDVVSWSGDNNNSLIGVGGWSPETVVVSLGTSDTCFSAMSQPHVDPAGYGHVFGNPAGGYMGLSCFKNGSLAREKVKEAHELSWDQFDELILEKTCAGNEKNMMLPFFVPEITPAVLDAQPVYRGSDEFVGGRDPAAAVRAVVEAQALSMRYHSSWLRNATSVLRVTGGASRSLGMCRVLADVFQVSVERLEVENSAALGAAMRAAQACGMEEWRSLTEKFCHVSAEEIIEPVTENARAYEHMLPQFVELLAETLDTSQRG